MKVDTEDFSEQWADSLSIRIQLPLPSDPSEFEPSDEDCGSEAISSSSRERGFTRSSPTSLMALRSLPIEASLVLFTPFLVRADSSDTDHDDLEHGDPFERLGRELAKRHPNICHVPYVGSVGFTETHLGFVVHSEAVITVTCEPNHHCKKESMSEQHDFAEAALKAFVSRPTKLPGDGEYVLVQCATDDARRRAQYAFANVIETDFYNEQTAAYLADTILGHT